MVKVDGTYRYHWTLKGKLRRLRASSQLTMFVSRVDLRLQNAKTWYDNGWQGAWPQQRGGFTTQWLHLGNNPRTTTAGREHKEQK
jgi:hypothetical protein